MKISVLAVLCGLGIFSGSFLARADVDAVTLTSFDAVGYVNGGVAFSFTPTTNLAVTEVSYLEYTDATNPIISFWSGTNFPIASYPLIPGTNIAQMNTTNVSLTLLAGRRYSLVLQDGPFAATALSSNRPALVQVSLTPHFQVASQLLNYVSATIVSNAVWGNFNSNVFYLGPDFSFQIQTSSIVALELAITSSNSSTASVSWQVSPGYVLQQNQDLRTTNWTLITNAVSAASGTNHVIISPLGSNQFFRLIHP